jgi:hypothetical protein
MSIDERLEAVETAKVILLYSLVFGRGWPKGWKIHWNVLGCCDEACKTIILNNQTLREEPYTVIHELVHLAYPRLRHGKRFDKLVRSYYMKARKEFNWKKRG